MATPFSSFDLDKLADTAFHFAVDAMFVALGDAPWAAMGGKNYNRFLVESGLFVLPKDQLVFFQKAFLSLMRKVVIGTRKHGTELEEEALRARHFPAFLRDSGLLVTYQMKNNIRPRGRRRWRDTYAGYESDRDAVEAKPAEAPVPAPAGVSKDDWESFIAGQKKT